MLHYSIVEGIYNHLQKIGNPMSEAFMILCIAHTIPKEYSPYLFKFIETCEEPMLMEIYELLCKAEDDLRVKLGKIKKRKADEEHGYKIGKGFEYIRDLELAKKEKELQEEGTHCSGDDCSTTSSSKRDEARSSSYA
uniref:Uncharacterized protein n=1 Tax=Tanacetum cinerariifolium TaxID=118510 RepID=A0A699JFX6_TANCI|nr:hypothetical protein [Tanacetum cinerariifolium]